MLLLIGTTPHAGEGLCIGVVLGSLVSRWPPREDEERAAPLYAAIERFIPDVRERVEVELIGSPLTHERFLRRHRGTYGPELSAADSTFPGAKTQVDGLLCCGDSCWPGIGVPAVAGSGIAAAHVVTGTL